MTETEKKLAYTVEKILTGFKSWSRQIEKSGSWLVSTVETPRLTFNDHWISCRSTWNLLPCLTPLSTLESYLNTIFNIYQQDESKQDKAKKKKYWWKQKHCSQEENDISNPIVKKWRFVSGLVLFISCLYLFFKLEKS